MTCKALPEDNFIRLSISEAVLDKAAACKQKPAIYFQHKSYSYSTLSEKVETLSKVLYSLNVKRGDRVLVVLPNIPQAVYTLYAVNRIGGVSAFVSPLSAEAELEFYINKCKCSVIITLDTCLEKLLKVFEKTEDKTLIVTTAADELDVFSKTAYKLKNPQDFSKHKIILWDELFKSKPTIGNIYISPQKPEDTAVILFSGGTTGTPKAVELTNLNLNVLALGTKVMCENRVEGVRMLAVLPVFHGFGLGICVHTVLYFGGEILLVPRFEKESVGKIISRKKPHYISCVPAMLEPMMNAKSLRKADLSVLLGVFSGGDSLGFDLKERFDSFLESRGASVKIRQGYGATECVAAVCLMPSESEKYESSGLPYPETMVKIVEPHSLNEISTCNNGEICISGKTVMKGYLDDKTETEKVLKMHSDGKLWLHTGDLGYLDDDGFLYFKQRLKRVVVTNGYNVYPAELEKALLSHSKVQECCAVGVSDSRKIQAVVMFVAVNVEEKEESLRQEFFGFLSQKLSKQSMPQEIYFVEKLPRTALGKISYAELCEIAENKRLSSD